MRKFVLLSSVVMACLAGCAATPMKDDTWAALVKSQAESAQIEQRCCIAFNEVKVLSAEDTVEFSFDSSAASVDVDGIPSLAVRLPLEVTEDRKILEFFSYSDEKRGLLRLGSLTFIRPHLIFLGANNEEIERVNDAQICIGNKSGYGGVWSRVRIPVGAKSVLITSNIQKPMALVDTRQLFLDAGAVTTAIAEARQSYISEVRFGHTGLVSVEQISQSTRARGRCVEGS